MTRGARLRPPVAAARHNNLTGWLLGGRVLLLTNIVRIERLPGAPPPLGTAAAHAAPLRRGEYPRAPLECFHQSERGGGRRGAGLRGGGKSGEGVGVPKAVRGRAPVGQCGSSRCEGRVASRRPSPAPPRGATDTCRPQPRCQVISRTHSITVHALTSLTLSAQHTARSRHCPHHHRCPPGHTIRRERSKRGLSCIWPLGIDTRTPCGHTTHHLHPLALHIAISLT